MTRFLAFSLALLLSAAPAIAAPVANLVLAASGVDDGVAPLADVWQLTLDNSDSALDITSITLDITPDEIGASEFFFDGFTSFYLNPSDLVAANNSLPEFRGAPITHTFMVLPGDLTPLEVGTEVTGSGIVANYTTAGGILVPAGDTVGVAHISVPAGTPVPDLAPLDDGVLGNIVYADNSTAPIVTIPEPATALLAGLALVGFAARRK